jgi:hypothetical protein
MGFRIQFERINALPTTPLNCHATTLASTRRAAAEKRVEAQSR